MNAPFSRREPPKIGVRGPIGRTPPIISQRAAATATSSVAPVCPITRGEVPPTQPGIKVPYVPRATDLPSAIVAINSIIDTIISNDSTPTIRWLEKWRVTAIVRITNPDDDSQWVDVERIQQLMMEDQINGDLWFWELGSSEPPAPTSNISPVSNQGVPGTQNNQWLTGTVVRPPGF